MNQNIEMEKFKFKIERLEAQLEAKDQQWLDKIKRAMPEWERSNKAILLFIANLQAEGIDLSDNNQKDE